MRSVARAVVDWCHPDSPHTDDNDKDEGVAGGQIEGASAHPLHRRYAVVCFAPWLKPTTLRVEKVHEVAAREVEEVAARKVVVLAPLGKISARCLTASSYAVTSRPQTRDEEGGRAC